MNFLEIQNDVLERCQYSSAASSEPRTRMKRFINFWHQRILADARFTKLRDSRMPLVLLASTAQYGLPPVMAQVARVYDAANNNVRLTPQSLDWLRNNPRADVDTGTPQHYIPIGLRPIFRLPAVTGIWAASTSAADTTQTVRMDAVRAGGYPHTPAATVLTGTARVQLGTRTDYTDVIKVNLSAACAGDIALYDAAAAGNVLGVIPIGLLFSRFWVVQIWPVPDTTYTYQIEGKLRVPTITADTDEPMFPEDFHQILCTGAYVQEMADFKKQLEQANRSAVKDLEPQIKEMLGWLVNTPDYIVVPDRYPAIFGNNLGSWFPVGRW